MPLNAAELILARSMEPANRIRPAIYCNGKTILYAELHALINRAANAFIGLNVQRGDRVPLLLDDGPVHAACILGLMKMGAVAVPLNTRLKPEEIKHIAADCGAKVFVHDVAYAEQVKEITDIRLLPGTAHLKDSLRRRMDVALPQAAFATLEEDDPCFWLYSSGTTGFPKGIIHSQRSAAQSSKLMREVLKPDETSVVLCTSKLFFAFALDNGLLGVIREGGALLLNEAWAEPETILAQVERYQPDIMLSVPSFFRRLLQLGVERLAPFAQVPLYATSGERMPDSLALQWKEATGHDLLVCHGMSETFCNTFTNRPDDVRLGSCGKPLEGVETIQLARGARPGELFASAEPVGLNELGVLWIKHPSLALRYNIEKKNAESFTDGWFCTNDLFRVDAEGYWFHEGRADELMKVAGQWVKPQEVEDAVFGEHVREAACVVVADAEGFERLALYVVPAAENSLEAIEAQAREKLPEHSLPKWIRSVEELPRTPTGEVQRFKLREMIRLELGFAPEPEPMPEPPVDPSLADAPKPKRKPAKSRAKRGAAQDTTGELPLAEALPPETAVEGEGSEAAALEEDAVEALEVEGQDDATQGTGTSGEEGEAEVQGTEVQDAEVQGAVTQDAVAEDVDAGTGSEEVVASEMVAPSEESSELGDGGAAAFDEVIAEVPVLDTQDAEVAVIESGQPAATEEDDAPLPQEEPLAEEPARLEEEVAEVVDAAPVEAQDVEAGAGPAAVEEDAGVASDTNASVADEADVGAGVIEAEMDVAEPPAGDESQDAEGNPESEASEPSQEEGEREGEDEGESDDEDEGDTDESASEAPSTSEPPANTEPDADPEEPKP